MKIALVHDWLTGMRGGEKCLEVLCRRFPGAPLFTLLHRPGSVSRVIENRPLAVSGLQRVPGITRHYRYFLPLMPRAIERLKIPADVDLVVSFSHAVAKGILTPPGVPHVCYCFTPMRYAWDLREDYFGRPSNSLVKRPWQFLRGKLLDRVREWDKASSQRVTHFVAISQAIADRIAASYGRESQIIYPPVDTTFYTPADVPREDFYLCVSALVPYKRVDLAIEACNKMNRRLIVIGNGPQQKRLARLAGPTVSLLGWLADEDIRGHYRRCKALLFPGHEDFGIVPVEAQACGAAVIAFRKGGTLETVRPPIGDTPGTGLFFDEQSVNSLCRAMAELESNPESVSSAACRQQAEPFATERYERELLALLERAAAR
ncbi:MAG: glycosyltransferase [Pirellulales bacterium]